MNAGICTFNRGKKSNRGKKRSPVLHATGKGILKWSPADGLSCVNCLSPIARPVHSTMYTVSLTDSTGCVSVDSVLVSISRGEITWGTIQQTGTDLFEGTDRSHVITALPYEPAPYPYSRSQIAVIGSYGQSMCGTFPIPVSVSSATFSILPPEYPSPLPCKIHLPKYEAVTERDDVCRALGNN